MKKKLIAVLLCVALLLSVVPIVSAESSSNTDSLYDTTINQAADTDDKQSDEPYMICELTEKRTQNTKYFLMSDRSITAAVYDKPVHYQNGDAWENIDNSFSVTEDSSELENKNNSLKTKFSKKSNGNKLVTVAKDNFTLSWSLDNSNKVDAEINQTSESQNADMSALKNLEGLVTYPEIQDNVDLQYVVSGEDIKENIILKSANVPLEYNFTYKIKKLKHRTNEQNQIEFYDENDSENVVFIIDTPYMYDAEKAYSNNIEMQITETNNGFTLTLIPDKEWLLSEDRVFPVVLDPTTLGSQKATSVWDIEVRNTQTSAFWYKAGDFLVGSDTNGQVYRTLLKFYELPDIGVGGIVVNAEMNITAYQGPAKDGDPALRTRPTDDIQVNIHRITADWPEQGVVWNDYANSYNSTVEDYFIYNDTDEAFVADITEIVSGWYSGTYSNYGVMLKANSEAAANHVMQFASSDWGVNDTNSATWRPVLLVNYRNSIGLEDYWTYSSKSLGQYGTGHVNLYNGNLVYVHDDTSFNSLINGFTLSHVFNSDLSYEGTGRYGNGWGLNLVQYFRAATIDGNSSIKFVYTDGDGTKHYFVQLEDGSIVDEDGLGYTYTSLSGAEFSHQLTDKDGNILQFEAWGALRKIIDTNGNAINLNYSVVDGQFNYLTSITTSSGGTISLNYDSEYKLVSIVDNADRVMYFSYTNGNLTKITYPDNTALNLSYSGNNLCQITLPDGTKQCYFYYSSLRVSAENFKNADNVMSDQLCFNYYHNKSEAIDLYARKMTYQFDSFGRATCIYDGNQNIYSQSYTEISASSNGIFKNNKVTTKSNGAVYINNLANNPVFSNGLTGWSTYSGGSSATRSVVTDHSLLSSNSILVSTEDQIHSTIYQTVNISGSKTYTLSAYMKTVNVESSGLGAGIEIATSEGRYVHGEFKTGTSDTSVDNGFEKYTLTVELQDGEYITSIGAGLFVAKGSVYIDCIQLEEGDTANRINLLTNSSFESGSVTGFTTNFGSSTGNGVSATESRSGTYSCKIAGYPSQTRSIYQRINTVGKAGDIYSIGGWGKADSVPTTNSSLSSKPNFRMYLNVYNGSSIVEAFEIKFNENVTDWQFASKTVIVSKDYTMLEAFFCYDFNCNTAYFDNMFLYRDTMQSYTYDEDGNVLSTADYAKQQSTFEYSDNNLAKVINPNGTEYTYEYDDNNNLTSASSNIGVNYGYNYDSNGNATQATVTADGTDDKITSSATYQSNGNFPHTVTDSRGNTTTYTYDTTRGLQTGVTDAKGISTMYNYNSLNDRLDSVTSGDSTVGYTYENDGTLKSITSPSGTAYNFTYDEFGNTTQISVGSNVLTQNTYDVTRGLLTKSVYCNEGLENGAYRTTDYIYESIEYTYDLLDRVTEKLYNGIPRVTFRYDKFGNLYEKQDLFTNTTYRYSYDLIGRITGISGSNGTALNYVYDDFNRVEKYVAKFADKTNKTEYIYGDSAISGQKDGLIYGVKQNGTQRISYAYDSLARLQNRTLNTTTPFVTEYGYLQGATDGTTTTLVKTVQNGNDVFLYSYDKVGNIIQIEKNGVVYESYTYDSLNQLKTVTRGTDVYEYTYDNGGNIQSVTLNGETIKSYGYTDTNWKDKLTSFNGETITYDEIGNPLTYRDGFSFSWANGRQLTDVTKDDNKISYAYNADGLRASKTVNGTVTDYYWLDGMLLGEKTGDNVITYLYDENGTIYGFVYNNTNFYYSFNAQGDVVALIDITGSIVARYFYDAWGNLLFVTNNAGTDISDIRSHIANINPIRYRGYYYDSETGFYYLQSRYYDPITHRFLNADGLVSTGQGILGTNMFAYCGNNPVNLKDSTGRFWEHVITVIVVTVVATIIINSVLSKNSVDENYNNNSAKETSVSVNAIVDNQEDDSVGGLSIGVGNVANNGCGAVAIHNAKVLKGKDSTMSDTIKDVQNSGGLILAGTLGVNPFVVNNILKKSDIQGTRVGLDELNQPGIYIIAYWNSEDIRDGAHFVTVKYDGNTYVSYNYSGEEPNPQDYAKNYIYGYRIH